jgi:hypothetical protein
VKALSDIIVTSSSAEIILSQIPKDQKIIFGPDKNLGGWLRARRGRDMLLWPGVCIVQEAFSETELLKLKAQHPGAPVLAHPECPPQILDHADQVGSTKAILDYALDSPSEVMIVATEPHIIHQMEKAAPHKKFIGAPGADGNCNCNMCPYMALNTMEKLYVSLRDLEPRIELDEDLRLAAKKSLDRMLDMAGRTVGQGDVGRARDRRKLAGDHLALDGRRLGMVLVEVSLHDPQIARVGAEEEVRDSADEGYRAEQEVHADIAAHPNQRGFRHAQVRASQASQLPMAAATKLPPTGTMSRITSSPNRRLVPGT